MQQMPHFGHRQTSAEALVGRLAKLIFVSKYPGYHGMANTVGLTHHSAFSPLESALPAL